MAGAIIPDDWDGSTFKCNEIQWPSSPQWKAILLGQVTEPAWRNYWDADTGDVGDATDAVNEAFGLTIPDVYFQECDELPPVIAFNANQASAQSIPAATWTTVVWDTLRYDYNSPGFSLALNAHTPTEAAQMGLWHYDITLRLTTSTTIYMRAMQNPGPVSLAVSVQTGTMFNVSFETEHIVTGEQVFVEVFTSVAQDLIAGQANTYFDGHFVGPID